MSSKIDQATGGTMCVTVNVHGASVELRAVNEDRLVGRYAYGNYMPNGVDRLLRLFQALNIPATFFVPGREAERHPEMIREINAAGHEIAANGYALEDHSTLGDAQLDVLKRAHEVIAECIGEAPVGWRAPDGLMSTDTLSHLSALGYKYDSSFQDDDFPYLLDADGGAGMVELPQNPTLLDQNLFSIKQPDVRVHKNWTEEFNGLNSVGAFICMTLHPRQDYGVGRAPRMKHLESFLRETQYSPRPIAFKTCAEVAALAMKAAA